MTQTSASDPPALRASVLVIGDELLGGFVQDTNSGWLAQRLQVLGIPLDRIVTVPDQAEAVDEALQAELARTRPRVIVTSGGIGPTPDDLTLEAVARSLRRELVTQPTIDARITAALARTAAAGMTVAPGHERSMRKMSRVPAGSGVLPGARGVAPGVVIAIDGGLAAERGATVVVLPGVPSEFRRIVTEGVEPALLAGRGRPQHLRELTHAYPESLLGPALERLVTDFPEVAVGSYPGPVVTLRLRGPRAQVDAAATVLGEILNGLEADEGAGALRADWRARTSPGGAAAEASN